MPKIMQIGSGTLKMKTVKHFRSSCM